MFCIFSFILLVRISKPHFIRVFFLEHFLLPGIIFSSVDTRMGHGSCSVLCAHIVLFPYSLHIFIFTLLTDPRSRLNFRAAHCQLVTWHDPKLPFGVITFQEFAHPPVYLTIKFHAWVLLPCIWLIYVSRDVLMALQMWFIVDMIY